MMFQPRNARRSGAALLALAAALYGNQAAAEPDPAARGFGAPQLPAPALTPEEEQQLEQDMLEEELRDQERQQPQQPQQPQRPPAKRAPLQSGAKQAPSGATPETGTEARMRTQTPRQVSGTVLGMKLVEVRGTGDENVIVLVKTDKGDRRLAIDLGPVSQLEGADLRVGGGVVAEGYVVAVRDQQFLVATRVKPQQGPLLVIRRPAQARLAAGGAGAAPSAQPPLAPKPDMQTLPPLEGLERGPFPPDEDALPNGAEVAPSPPNEGQPARTRKEMRRQQVEEQQRPGGD